MSIKPQDDVRAASDEMRNDAIWKRLTPGGTGVDLVLEIVLVITVSVFFIYLWLAVGGLRSEAARLPKYTAIGGLILVAVFIVQKVWGAIRGRRTTLPAVRP